MSLTDVWRVTSNPYAATGLAIALSALLALKRRSQVLALVLVVFALASFATAAVEGSIRWAWILSLLPAAMIVDHAAFLAMVRKIHFPGEGAA